MNTERLKTLRDFLKDLPSKPDTKFGFNMGSFIGNDELDKSGHNCKTTCCIGGWTIKLFAKEEPANYGSYEAQALLELTIKDAINLFFPPSSNLAAWNATPTQAAAAIDRLIEGKKPWPLEELE